MKDEKNNTATEGLEEATNGANVTSNDSVKEKTGHKTGTNKATEEVSGVYVHRFKKPFEYDGTKYETLNFYFDKLNGEDMLKIENEMQDNNEYALSAEVSKSFQCKMAARAARVGSDVILAMPIGEFNRITNAARRFLLDTGY